MLEQNIKDLTNEIHDLRRTVDTLLNYLIDSGQSPKAKPKSKKETPAEPMPTDQEVEAAVEEAKKAPAVDRASLQSLCLDIVRADRSKKATIKSLLADYGAKVIADVPEDKLADLKTALEAMQ